MAVRGNCTDGADVKEQTSATALDTRDVAAQPALAHDLYPSGYDVASGAKHCSARLPASTKSSDAGEKHHTFAAFQSIKSLAPPREHRSVSGRTLASRLSHVLPQELPFAAAHYHTNTNPVGSTPLFNSLSVRQEQLLQDAGNEIDAEFSYNSNISHSLSAPNFFGALNGYNTDEEEDIKQLSGGYLGGDEYSVDSSDDDAPEPALFMTRGMEDVPPPPSWRQDPEVALASSSSHTTSTDAPQDAHIFPALTEPLQMPSHDAPDLRQHPHPDSSPALSDVHVSADDQTAFPTPWRSPVAAGMAPPPDVDARQAMRDSLRQRASQQVVQTAGDVVEEHLAPQLYPGARSHRPRRPRLPTTPMRQPRPDPDAQQGRPVAVSVLAEAVEADGATAEELEDLAALVSPCSAAAGASERRHPYATVNPVCEHQTWNLFNSAAAGLLSTVDLRTVSGSVRAALGLSDLAAVRPAEAGRSPPAAAAAAAEPPAGKPKVMLFQECWQDTVTASQMQYVAERLQRTGRVPLTRPRDDTHARAAVSVHQDIAVTDHALKKFEESSCWGEVERCATEIVAEAAAAEAAAAAADEARAAAVVAAERSYDSARAGLAAEDESAGDESAHAARVWGAGVYGGVGVPLGGGVPAFAIVQDGLSSELVVGVDDVVSHQAAELRSSVGAAPSGAVASAELAASRLREVQAFSTEDAPAVATAVPGGGREAGAGCSEPAFAGPRGGCDAAGSSSVSARRLTVGYSRKVPRRKIARHGGVGSRGAEVPQGSVAPKKLRREGSAAARLHTMATRDNGGGVGDTCASVPDASAEDRSASNGGSAAADAVEPGCGMHAALMPDCSVRGRDSGAFSNAVSCSGGADEEAAEAYSWTNGGGGLRDGTGARGGLHPAHGQGEHEDRKAYA